MPRSETALVEPALLTWARESAGFSLEEAAHKAGIKAERLQAWEVGQNYPSVVQLRKLGSIYRRPIAVFYLPEAPRDFRPLRDFRQLQDREVLGLSPALRFEIRSAHDRREIALEVYQETETVPVPLTATTHLTQDTESVGAKVRQLLNISVDTQKSWKGLYGPFNGWREALEVAGVLVFQTSELELSEARGFSISETPLPVIVVNRKDAPTARVFTLLHEFLHLLLRAGGLCDLSEDGNRRVDEEQIETFCNYAAGAVLVPRESLLSETVVAARVTAKVWSDDEIESLARAYGVSREVLVRRLLILGRTTEDFYKEKRDQYQEELKRKRRAEGFVPPHIDAISVLGRPYTRLILTAFRQDRITASDVSDFLGVRLKHLGKIEALVATP